VSRDYSSGPLVGIDLHRRRSVICRMNAAGEVLGSVRIENDRAALLREVGKAGAGAPVAIEATYGVAFSHLTGAWPPRHSSSNRFDGLNHGRRHCRDGSGRIRVAPVPCGATSRTTSGLEQSCRSERPCHSSSREVFRIARVRGVPQAASEVVVSYRSAAAPQDQD
jgi:hypothetical protein